MIEKMQMVTIVTTLSHKSEMLVALRDAGILHIAEKKNAKAEAAARVTSLSKVDMALKEYKEKKTPNAPVLSNEEFEEIFTKAQGILEEKNALVQKVSLANSELERITEWGEFSPEELKALKQVGLNFHFYTIGKNELQMAAEDENVRFIHLAPIGKMDAIAVLGTLPENIQATEFTLPEMSAEEYRELLKDSEQGIEKCAGELKELSIYGDSFKKQILRAQNAAEFSSASETAETDEELVWLTGYVPTVDLEIFKKTAEEHNCAWAVEEVDEEDLQVPTKLRYTKVSKLIEPVFNLLGILPGYREQDISIYFLLFFTLFFAMIIGDAGYGTLILIGTIAFALKTKSKGNGVFLLLVLSIATIVWGAITGNWFGMESAMNVPFLKALVVPSFSNYPELFGLTDDMQQKTIMKFSFSIGAIQMCLGAILAIRKKISEKNLSWVADFGWMVAIVGMYLLSLTLVIGENINLVVVGVLIGCAFLLVVLFGGMSPDKTFAQGLKAGLGGAFTTFLDTISCFGNVMSYIRLFAVGMAGLAIAQSFNSIASGFHGFLIIVGVVVVLIGHSLNLVMSFLSVVVHGIRLNVMEFSGQAGLEWTGIAYEPFKLKNK